MQSRRILVAAFMAVAGTAQGQSARRGGPPAEPQGPPGGGLATRLIDARRELNLTPRQLLALDSLERAEFTQRKQAMETMRVRRDSLCANRRPCELTRGERQQIMGGPSGIEGRIGDRLRTDSLRRTRIMGMLDTTQRRLADRLDSRQGRFDRMDRRVNGPSRYRMREQRMRDYGPRSRQFRGDDGYRGWDGPPGFRNGRDRMRGDRWRDDRDDFGPGNDRWMGPGARWDDRGGPPPRRRLRGDEEAPTDSAGQKEAEADTSKKATPSDTTGQQLP